MKRTWTADELLEHFTLLPDELTAVSNKSGATRLGFAVLFKCLQYEGRFPRSRSEVAPDVVRFLAVQVGVDAALFAQYDWEGRTIEAHRAQIRGMTKMREFRRTDEEALLDWLCTGIFHHEETWSNDACLWWVGIAGIKTVFSQGPLSLKPAKNTRFCSCRYSPRESTLI